MLRFHMLSNHFRFVTQLLADVTYFVADQENSGGDPLEVSVSKPDRERQKLLREQNILKQVPSLTKALLLCLSCKLNRLLHIYVERMNIQFLYWPFYLFIG